MVHNNNNLEIKKSLQMNSKHAIDFSSRKKKKHSMLSIAKKVKLLEKYDQGTPVQNAH